MHRFLWLPLFVTSFALGASDLWDLPPLRYSDTASKDPIARLAEGSGIEGRTPLEKLRFVLKSLEVPEASQILVFSKTSKQNGLIHPGNPRAIYFNENHYVGYVPGGDIEVIAQDDLLGPVFYLIRAGKGEKAVVMRDTADCLSCHGTARTESVPGVLVRSVFPDDSGHPLLALGTFQIDHASPIEERWGGYYVTGRSSLPHLGNRTYHESDGRSLPDSSPELHTLEGKIDVSKYLRPTSDILALMVLEHQCQVHNHLVAAAMNYRRVHWLQSSLNPSADPDQGAAGKLADDAAAKIVDLLLFRTEASIGVDGIEGNGEFQEAFAARFPKSSAGRSLADFQLNDRLFKHRCSFMVYSRAFTHLPPRVKSAVISQLSKAFEEKDGHRKSLNIRDSEQKKILSILAETLPGWTGK
jgi:hypothetical protein